MKALQLCLLTLLAFISIITPADAQTSTPDPEKTEKPNVELRKQVVRMIRYANLTGVPRHQRDATIDFIVTKDNQLLILNIDSFSPYLKNFIKQRLNYKKIKVEGVKKLTMYRLDVKFMARGT